MTSTFRHWRRWALAAAAVVTCATSASGQCAAWQPVATDAPPAYGSSIVYDVARDRVVLYSRGDTWEFDGVDWTLVATTGPHSMFGEAMAYDRARGVTVLFGGSDGERLRETWEWNGTAWSLRSVVGPSARSEAAMAFDEVNAVMVLFGGTTSTGQMQTWQWDGTAWTLRAGGSPFGRTGHVMAYDSSRGVVVMTGGYGGIIDETWEWDGAAWTQREGDKVTPGFGRAQASLVEDRVNGRLLLYGGTSDPDRSDEIWSLTAEGWTLLAAATGRASLDHGACFHEALGRMVVFGGQYVEVPTLLRDDLSVWLDDRWQALRDPSPDDFQQSTAAAAFDTLRSRAVYFTGEGIWQYSATGYDLLPGRAERSASVAFDTSTGTFFAAIGGPVPGIVTVRDYDYTSWSTTATIDIGGLNASAQVAYDAGRNVRVLVERRQPEPGIPTTFQTWENDGSGWMLKADDGRRADVLVYAPSAGGVLTYSSGGAAVWDGSAWHDLVGEPTALTAYSLTYDPLSAKAVLVGRGPTAPSADPLARGGIWSFDGVQWEYVGNPTPAPQSRWPLLFDPTRDVYIVPRWDDQTRQHAELDLDDIELPQIVTEPQDAAAALGGNVVFSVEAQGLGSLSYQWFRNGSRLLVGFGPELAVNVRSFADFGQYTVRVTGSCGQIFSRIAHLTYVCAGADWNLDGVTNSTDVSEFVNDWFEDQAAGTLVTDINQDGVSNSADVSEFVNRWFDAPAECR